LKLVGSKYLLYISQKYFKSYLFSYSVGFLHSSYTFGHESLIVLEESGSGSSSTSNLAGQQHGQTVPPGALISLLQKGIKFLQVEAHMNEVSNF
jgi:hypothetical protein